MSVLSIDHLSLNLADRAVLEDVSFSIDAGEVVGLLGPNGAGKTSLMRGALGLIETQGYSSIATLTAEVRARAVAWLPQTREIAWPVPVERLVALGRLPHIPRGSKLPTDDQAKVDSAISRMDLENLRKRPASQLSGGEQARVLIARAIAQDTPLLMADEPVAGLDPAHQIATMEVFTSLAAEGRSVFVSIHDLGLAARHCSRLILMAQGKILANGPPSDVLSAELMASAFGISVWHQNTDHGPVFQSLSVL